MVAHGRVNAQRMSNEIFSSVASRPLLPCYHIPSRHKQRTSWQDQQSPKKDCTR